MNGAKRITEAMACNVSYRGRGAFSESEFDRKDRCVALRSEYVGISNEKTGEIPVR